MKTSDSEVSVKANARAARVKADRPAVAKTSDSEATTEATMGEVRIKADRPAVDNGALNLAWADAFVAGLTAAGLRRVVLAPGARSAPLALACLRRPELVCEVLNDERAAGYFALGLGRATRQPAALLCTSGTAAANLLPAVMEAGLAGVPLLVLTADRPPEAQGWGANQAADQLQLYGSQVRAFHHVAVPDAAVPHSYLHALAARLLEECRGPLPGPVHANLPFREPLLPATSALIPPSPLPPAIVHCVAPAGIDAAAADALAAQLSAAPGVIVCGEAAYGAGFAAALTTLAARLDAPILAEPLSNLRFGVHPRALALTHQALFLRQAELPAPAWVLRFGAFPVSRTLERWLSALPATHQITVAPPGSWPDPLWRHATLVRADALALVEALTPRVAAPVAGSDAELNAGPDAGSKAGSGAAPAIDPATAPVAGSAPWRAAEAQAAARAAQTCAATPLFEGTVARRLLKALPAGGHCFVGNSLAIRAVDAFGGGGDQLLTLHGNRGASGIDGNVATAAGIAAACGAPVALLLGDQAALHDCGSLAALAGRDVVAVVMDNGGGGIFDHLPLAQIVPAELLRRGWTAPSQVDFAALAAAFGLRYVKASDAATLDSALATAFAAGGAWLLRVVIDRNTSRARFGA